jgi:outer membrane protein assembly factor BamB
MRVGKINRYYNGVRMLATTICCSAVALTLAAHIVIAAQTPAPQAPSTVAVPPQPAAPPQAKPAPAAVPFRAIWNVELGGSLTALPAFSEGRGYFPMDGDRLVAYDLSEGTEIWTSTRSVTIQPAVGAGRVFVAEPGGLTALGEAEGIAEWQRPFADALAAPLGWDNGWLIAATESGSIHAFRASDGELIWRNEIGARANARPVLAGDRVYIAAANNRVVALQLENGETVWQRQLGGAPNDILALDERLYVGSDDNYFYCIRTDTGSIDWRWPTGADVVGIPVIDDDRVYFVSKDNVLRALDRGSGNQRWKRFLPLRPLYGPIAVGSTVMVSGVAPAVHAYSMRDGSPAGEIAADGELAAPPYELPEAEAPTLIVVSRQFGKGVMVKSFSRVAPAPPATSPTPPPPAPSPTTPSATPTAPATSPAPPVTGVETPPVGPAPAAEPPPR